MSQETERTVGDVLFEKAYTPAFIAKCAEYGIAPKTQEDLDALLEIAAGIRVKEAQLANASHNAQSNVIKQAAAYMRNTVGIPEASEEQVSVDPKAVAADQELLAALKSLRG